MTDERERMAARNANCYYAHPVHETAPRPAGWTELYDSFLAGYDAGYARGGVMAVTECSVCLNAVCQCKRIIDSIRARLKIAEEALEFFEQHGDWKDRFSVVEQARTTLAQLRKGDAPVKCRLHGTEGCACG